MVTFRRILSGLSDILMKLRRVVMRRQTAVRTHEASIAGASSDSPSPNAEFSAGQVEEVRRKIKQGKDKWIDRLAREQGGLDAFLRSRRAK